MKRHNWIRRRKPIRKVNKERKAKKDARNFGDRRARIHEMECCVPGCRMWSVAAHTRARGMGGVKGDRRDLVNLCWYHHSVYDNPIPSQLDRAGGDFDLCFERRFGANPKRLSEALAIQFDEEGLD